MTKSIQKFQKFNITSYGFDSEWQENVFRC